MSTVPFIFANNTGNIPLSQLDANFANVKLSVDFVIQNTQANITSVGTLTGLAVGGNANIAGNLTVIGSFNATGNVTHGNIFSTGIISAVGNVIGGNLLTAGRISTSGNISVSNLNATGITSTAVLQAVNISATGTVSSVGNITAPLFLGNLNGNIVATTVSATSAQVSGNVVVGNLISNTSISGSLLDVSTLIVNSISSDDSTAIAINDGVIIKGSVEADAGIQVSGATLRLPSFTTTQIANLAPGNGDLIYNSSLNKFQGYENGAWANII